MNMTTYRWAMIWGGTFLGVFGAGMFTGGAIVNDAGLREGAGYITGTGSSFLTLGLIISAVTAD